MDLTYSEQEIAFRAEVRAWMAEHVPEEPLPSFDASREGFDAHRAWEAVLNEGRWGMVTWPEEFGGRGLDLIRWLIFEEEYYAARAPLRVNQNGIFLLGPTLMEFGTEAQKARFLPKMATGEEIWAQAWSEPQAGSDLAAVRAKAVRDGDDYVLSGHKIWSSRAVYADWAFGLFRTDPESERHRGLSLILFDLNSPGVVRQPIHQINGEHGFAELILEDVRVPAENIVGAEGQGWKICMATAGFERGLMLRSPARYQVAAGALARLAHSRGDALDPVLRARVADAAMNAEAYALSIYATASRLEAGGKIGAEASTNKIFWSEMDIALHETALDILGDRAELLPDAPGAQDAGTWLDGYLFALAGPIYAGTNEIQRNIIAERMLGLPRG
ncbi:acyl-CoA dehydrogenase [Thalassorhabdomicrobium marinisediminis]|uniref:Acyl-CoA dehydrogenase n=1 Tax=Thalassorhabdomicrobium marinisediminis TaxID=2170577 RepID=A0A2T7FU75_9RHOB|nr:acyl-CoA dehydrogenase [Thalassorhabdomicrobium marinisediminis]PVA05720.1 acyl-CoA dehydrogenase [Thalassorhabdomicrobium marinisediminis]